MMDENNASATPQSSVLTVPVVCNLCGRTVAEPLFQAKDRLYGCEGTFTYVKCRTCGLVYMNPQIREDCLWRVYPADYSPHQAKTKQRQPSYKKSQAELKKMPFVASVCARLNRESRLLDVGCGSGLFLSRVAMVTQCEVHGVDNSQAAAETARRNYGIDVFAGTIFDAPFPDERFDAITAWWCLEHVSNPLQVLHKIHRLLKPGGCCIVGVPSIAGFNARLFGDRWYHLDCPRHLYIYSPDTISKFMEKAGLFVEGIAHSKGTRGLTHSLRYRFGDSETPLKYREHHLGSRPLKALAHLWSTLLAWLRQSDLIVVCARKGETTPTP